MYRTVQAASPGLMGNVRGYAGGYARGYATSMRGKYRNPNGTMTAAAIRARRPYALKNALLGVSMLLFGVGCYFWAYQNFTPDDFGDVPVPPLSEEELAKLREEYGLNKKK